MSTSTAQEPDPTTVTAHTYDATLYGPLFYASKEGTVIETDPVVAATAVMHALGYEYYDLEKAFALAGAAATSADYTRLCELPLFASEMAPQGDIEVNERTFRTVAYTTERAVVSQDNAVGEYIRGSKKPVPRRLEGSNAGWHKVREYVGVPPGTEFSVTVWTPTGQAPPDRLGFRVGIGRTGELRARRRDGAAETVSINQYLLQSVFDVGEETVFAVMDRAAEYQRGNDIRTNRFIGVDTDWFTTAVAPELVQT